MLNSAVPTGPTGDVASRAGCLTALLCIVAVGLPQASAQPPAGMPPARVVVEEVTEETLSPGKSFIGSVVPLRRSTVGSQVEGRVVDLQANEGDRVAEGQPLAMLRTTSLEIDLKAAQAELQLREQELTELQLSEPEEIEQARARKDAAQTLKLFHEKRLKRFRELYDKNALSIDELEEQETTTASADETYNEMNAAWKLASSGYWEAKIAQAQARVLAQEEKINRIQDDITEHTITAPFDGFVTREHTEVGQWVVRGGPVAEVIQLDWVDVEVPVLERYIPQLRLGAAATVEIEVEPDGRQRWDGHVELIVPEADVRSRTFPVKVRLENEFLDAEPGEPGVLLQPGMFARVTLPVGREGPTLMVSKDALVLGGQSPMVWVVQPDEADATQGTVAPVPVHLGVSYGSLIEVRSEVLGQLQAGQQVVVEGNERVRPGQPVIILRRPQSSGIPRQEVPPATPEASSSAPPPVHPTGQPSAGPTAK